jgi:hypothetical protein
MSWSDLTTQWHVGTLDYAVKTVFVQCSRVLRSSQTGKPELSRSRGPKGEPTSKLVHLHEYGVL